MAEDLQGQVEGEVTETPETEEKHPRDYVSLRRLKMNNDLTLQYIDDRLGKPYRTLYFDAETNTFKAWVAQYTEKQLHDERFDVEPDFQVVIGNSSLELTDGEEGSIVEIGEEGTLKGSILKTEDIATKEYVDSKASTHLSKVLVTEEELEKLQNWTPSDEEELEDPPAQEEEEDEETLKPEENVIYLVKVDDYEAEDIYKEYTLINNELVCIGTTSTDLKDYITLEQYNSLKEEINDTIGEGFDAENTVAAAIEKIKNIIGGSYDIENTVSSAIDELKNTIGEGYDTESTVSNAIDNAEVRIADLEEKVGDGFIEVSEDDIVSIWEDIPLYDNLTIKEVKEVYNEVDTLSNDSTVQDIINFLTK